VREPDECKGSLGRIRGATFIPLGQVGERCEELSKAKPIVVVCRAGGRSAQATVILQKKGFENVANLSGGMLRWNAERHPVDGGLEFDAGL